MQKCILKWLVSVSERIRTFQLLILMVSKKKKALKCIEAVVGQPNPELPPHTNQLKQQDNQQQLLQQVTRQILKQDTLAPVTVSAQSYPRIDCYREEK